MEEFITVKILLSLPGCVTLVVLSTQLFKRYFKNVKSRTIALVLSGIIAVARIFAVGEYDITSIIIGIINILPILWGATGAYDTMTKKNKTPTDTTQKPVEVIEEKEIIKETNVIETNIIKKVENPLQETVQVTNTEAEKNDTSENDKIEEAK